MWSRDLSSTPVWRTPLPSHAIKPLGQRVSTEVFPETCGAKAAETRESVAQEREGENVAREDRTASVAQYVIGSPWAH